MSGSGVRHSTALTLIMCCLVIILLCDVYSLTYVRGLLPSLEVKGVRHEVMIVFMMMLMW